MVGGSDARLGRQLSRLQQPHALLRLLDVGQVLQRVRGLLGRRPIVCTHLPRRTPNMGSQQRNAARARTAATNCARRARRLGRGWSPRAGGSDAAGDGGGGSRLVRSGTLEAPPLASAAVAPAGVAHSDAAAALLDVAQRTPACWYVAQPRIPAAEPATSASLTEPGSFPWKRA